MIAPSDHSYQRRSAHQDRVRPCQSHHSPALHDKRERKDYNGYRHPDSHSSPHDYRQAAEHDRHHAPENGFPTRHSMRPYPENVMTHHAAGQADLRPAIQPQAHVISRRVRLPYSPPCQLVLAGYKTRPKRAHPRFRPYRHGNCHPSDTRARACDTNAGSRFLGLVLLPKWSHLLAQKYPCHPA